MSVDIIHAGLGQHIPMVSPPFYAHVDHCLLFDYKIWASPHTLVHTPAPRLEIYISGSNHVYSGRKMWTSNGTGEGQVQLFVFAQPKSVQMISFVGIVGDRESTSISVANIVLNGQRCTVSDCGQHNCDGSSTVSLLSVNCKFDISSESAFFRIHPLTMLKI